MTLVAAFKRLARARSALLCWFFALVASGALGLWLAGSLLPRLREHPPQTTFDWVALAQTEPRAVMRVLACVLVLLAIHALVIAPIAQSAVSFALRGAARSAVFGKATLRLCGLSLLRLVLEGTLALSWFYSARWLFRWATTLADERWLVALQFLAALPHLLVWMTLSMVISFAAGWVVAGQLGPVSALRTAHRELILAPRRLTTLWGVPRIASLGCLVCLMWVQLQAVAGPSLSPLFWPLALLRLLAIAWSWSASLIPAERQRVP